MGLTLTLSQKSGTVCCNGSTETPVLLMNVIFSFYHHHRSHDQVYRMVSEHLASSLQITGLKAGRYSFMFSECFGPLPSGDGVHPSPSETTNDILKLESQSW